MYGIKISFIDDINFFMSKRVKNKEKLINNQ